MLPNVRMLIEILRKQAAEVAAAGHNGWGNTMIDAAVEIDRLREEVDGLVQTSAELCTDCGWRFFVPGRGCLLCMKSPNV